MSTDRSPAYEIAIHNEQDRLPIDEERLIEAVERVLRDAEIPAATVSVAIVDDPRIREINAQYLNHDYATDVISFRLDSPDDPLPEGEEPVLEGEVVISADTATRMSAEFGWNPADELLLYLVHGMLHIVGYDDHSDEDLAAMRAQEQAVLSTWNLAPSYDSARMLDGNAEASSARRDDLA